MNKNLAPVFRCPVPWCEGDPVDHGRAPDVQGVLIEPVALEDPRTWMHAAPLDILIPGLTGMLTRRGDGPASYGIIPDYHPEASHDSAWVAGLAAIFAEAAETLTARACEMTGRRVRPNAAPRPGLPASAELPAPAMNCRRPWCAGVHLDPHRHRSGSAELFPGMVGYLSADGDNRPRYSVEYHYRPMSEHTAAGTLALAAQLADGCAELTARAAQLAALERGQQ